MADPPQSQTSTTDGLQPTAQRPTTSESIRFFPRPLTFLNNMPQTLSRVLPFPFPPQFFQNLSRITINTTTTSPPVEDFSAAISHQPEDSPTQVTSSNLSSDQPHTVNTTIAPQVEASTTNVTSSNLFTHQLDTTNTPSISPQVADLKTHIETVHLSQTTHDTLPVEALPTSSAAASVSTQHSPHDSSQLQDSSKLSLHSVLQQYLPPSHILQINPASEFSQELTLGSDIIFPRPVTYIVSQCLARQVLLVIDPSQPRDILDHAPALLQITEHTQFFYEGRNCGTGFTRYNVYPFCLFDVLIYAPLLRNNQPTPSQPFSPQVISQNMICERIRANAAAQFAAPLEPQPSLLSSLSLVQHSFTRPGDKRKSRKPTVQYIGRYAEQPNSAPPHLIDPSFTSLPIEGDFVTTYLVHAPKLAQVGNNCVLPPGYPIQPTAHLVTRDLYEAILVYLTPADPHQTVLLPDPFTHLSHTDSNSDFLIDFCRAYEDVLLAASVFVRHRLDHAMLSSAYVGASYTIQGSTLHAFVPAVNNPKIMSLRVRFWEPDTRMAIIPSTYRQQDSEQPPVSAVIQDVQLDKGMNITATLTLGEGEMNSLCRLAPQLTEELVIEPDTTRTGLEGRISHLRYRYVSHILQSPAYPSCANILRLLLGLSMPFTYKPATSSLTHPNLTDEQRAVLQHLKGGCPILFQQAPAGTGKTFVIAAFIQEYMQTSPKEIVFLAATTNMAVSNMAQAVLKLMPQLAPNELLFLQSLTNERLVNADEYLWGQYRLPELMSRLIPLNKFKRDELKFARDYTKNRLSHDGKGCHETKALQLALQANTIRIMLGTVAMLEQYLPVLRDYIHRCIFDEAGLIPEAQLLIILAGLPAISQVFLTGDLQQLPAYKANIPERILPYGFGSAIEAVARRNVIPMLSLNVSYRSHPFLTYCLSEAIYNGQLRPGVSSDDRSSLTASDFPLPIQCVPLALIHICGADTVNTWRSRYNRDQEEAALHIIQRLIPTITPQKITVLCFYLATCDYLRSELSDFQVDCHTVDSFQGKENDIIILVTTRSYDNRPVDESSIKFFADPQRITVALSRASHGLFIIADFPMLLKYATWQSYLRHATQETPIMSSRYVNALFERTHRDHRNMLVDERGHSFLPPDTMGINRKWHRY